MSGLSTSGSSDGLQNYQPEQGIVKQRDVFSSCFATFPLNQWVDSFWQLNLPAGVFEYHAVPDNCVDWIIPLNDPLLNQLVRPFLVPKFFHIPGPQVVFGIRFRVMGQYSLFDIPIGELDRDPSTLDLCDSSESEAVLDSVYEAPSFLHRCTRASEILFRQLKDYAPDRRLLRFLQYSFTHVQEDQYLRNNVRIPWDELGISQRQLRRLSHLYLGLPPKQFVRVLRFQQCLKSWSFNDSFPGLMSGFHDQSHFIREFRSLAGVTPGQFRKMSVLYNKQEHC